jgi:hypothetical protein
MREILVWSAVLWLGYWNATQTPAQNDAEVQAQRLVQQLVSMHAGWAKVSTPGASVQIKEVLRQGAVREYHFFVSGLPDDALYTMVEWPVTAREPSTELEGISIGKDGIVMCAGRSPEQCGDPKKPDDPIEFILQPVRGEPFRFALISSDSQYKIAFIIVPEPIQSEDKGCHIDVVRLLPKFETAYVSGSGFSPAADVHFDTRSYNEEHPLTATADSHGNLHFALMPFVAGHDHGTTTLKALEDTCGPELKFDWGVQN